MGGSKAKTVLYIFHIAPQGVKVLYYLFIEPDTRMAKNWKAFKSFFSVLSALDKTVKC